MALRLSQLRHGGPGGRRQRRLLARLSCLAACFGALIATVRAFVAGPNLLKQGAGLSAARGEHSRAGQVQVHFFGPSSQTGDQIYDMWSKEYPTVALREEYLGSRMDKGTVVSHFIGLSGLVGEEIAEDMVTKEPILLMFGTEFVSNTFSYLKGMETPEKTGQVLDILQKNPKVLTIPALELQRTNTSLDQLASSAGVIDLLRPLGPWGLFVAIFGGFAALLVVLRPILYGVGGGPSLLDIVTSPFRSLLSGLPNPAEFFGDSGINLSVFVGLFAVYNAGTAIYNRFLQEKK